MKKLISYSMLFILSLGFIKAEYTYYSTLLDFGDTLGGVVTGADGSWRNSPQGVAVAPDGNVWINIYGGSGEMNILANGDTVHYKGIYVLDPETGQHVDFSPITHLTFPDGSSDSLTAESASSGGGRGIEIDADGNILSSNYRTLYKINYMTGEGMAMWVGESSLTNAVADENGNIYVSYVLAGERPCVVLDGDLNYIGNAIDTVGHINRALEVTGNGEDMYIGSTWNGHGVTHWNSTVPGVIQHEFSDTFAVFYEIPACWEDINSGQGTESAYVICDASDADTIYSEVPLWSSSLNFDPFGNLLVGALTAGWGGPMGGTYWLFDVENNYELIGEIGNQHGDPSEGGTDGPRGAAWDAYGNVYLADFYANAIYSYSGGELPPDFDGNQSLSFDGSDDYVSVPSNSVYTVGDNYTIEAWINASSGDGEHQSLIQGWYGFGFQIYLTAWGNIEFILREPDGNGVGFSNTTDFTLIPDGNWHHIAAVLNEGNVSVFVDGSLETEGTFDNTVTGNGSDDLSFGHSPWASEYYSGLLDEIRIWNTALSESEIQSTMDNELNGDEDGLIGYWNFNEGEGTTLIDQTSNSNNGIINGATWNEDGAPLQPVSFASITVDTVEAFNNSTVSVPVDIDLMGESISSVEIRFAGFQNYVDFLDVDTSGTLVGDAVWNVLVNEQNYLLITGSYGVSEISTNGTLFRLQFDVPDQVAVDFVPINITHVEMDETEEFIDIINGGIMIDHLIYGDVSLNDNVSLYDASLILKYLVGLEELDEYQLLVADVTLDESVSALDASIIAQYVVELIDELPYDDDVALAGTGDISMEDGVFTPGELLEIPILLANGENLLSFEMDIEYDPEIVSYEALDWSDMIDHFTIEENNESDLVRVAGSGATPDGEEGVFANLQFFVANEFEGESFEISISNYRINENEPVQDIIVTFSNSTLGLIHSSFPQNFALHQNYPNPFNPVTTLRYDLPEDALVHITIYDMMGRIVNNLVSIRQDAGYKSIQWNAMNNTGQPVPAGVYLYTIEAGQFRQTKKMVLLK